MSAADKNIALKTAAIIAIAFGLLTIKSGGEVLFVDGAGREAAGNFVAYVLWFNFIMGFVYIIAGIGLWLQKRWSVSLSILIAVATLCVFAIFGLDIFKNGLYEQRTVGAMVLRSLVWIAISFTAHRKITS